MKNPFDWGKIKKFFGRDEKLKEGEMDERRNKRLFWMITGIVYFVFLMLDLIYLSRFHYENVIWSMDWNWGSAMFLLQMFYALISFRTVGPTKLGAILLFGKPLFDVGSGLTFAPFLVCHLETEEKIVMEDELPAKPELIFRSKKDEPEVVPDDKRKQGYKPPIRIQFGSPDILINIDPEESEERRKLYKTLNEIIEESKVFAKNDPLNVRMTAETPLTVRWQIESLVKFLQTFGTKEKARDQIQDIAVAVLNRDFSKITPAVAQGHLGKFSQLIQGEVKEMVEGGGIKIKTILLRPFVYSHELNDEILKKAKALVGKAATIINAEAQKKKDKLEGEGKGLAEKAVLNGRTQGLAKMAKKLRVSSETVIAAETARIIGSPTDRTIIAGSGGFADLLSAAAAISQTFIPKKKEEKK